MPRIFWFATAMLLLVTACKKDKSPSPGATNPFAGGKGGNYSRAFFTGHNGSPVAARMYLKYGDNKMPADTNKFDEKYNTMVEPGFSHHVHFEHLTKGTYFFYAVSATGNLKADTAETENFPSNPSCIGSYCYQKLTKQLQFSSVSYGIYLLLINL